ncbi:MAG: phosphoadenosine phosphosulfate reductase family protein, partial [Aureispira sp.]
MLHQLQLFETPTFNEVLPFDLLVDILDKEVTYLVCFSGGKDSIAMVLDLLERGVPQSKIILHHHEVDGRARPLFDWKVTTQYCRAFAEALGLTILFSYREGGILREMYREQEGLQDVLYQCEMDGAFHRLRSRAGNSTRRKFPAVAADLQTRWCSSSVKIDVLSRVIANHPDYQKGRFVICTGERGEESKNRARYKYWENYRATAPTKGRFCIQWRPILDWKEKEVWSILRRHRIQCHPCYELGWSRCSCQT